MHEFGDSEMDFRALPAIMILTLAATGTVQAQDVQVDGYYRDDGTYVRPHTRSAPDDSISNNYGPSQSDSELRNPRQRDYDNDGTPNYLDSDSDNDGYGDEYDSDPYSYD